MRLSTNHRWEVLSLTERKKNRKGIILRLLKYLFINKWLMITALLLTVVSNYANLLVPRYSGTAIDAISAEGGVNFPLVYQSCMRMLAMVIVSAVFGYITQLVLIRISARITSQMRKEVFDHLLTLPVSFFDKHQAGDIISRISYDINTINTSLSGDLIMILTTAITVFGSLTMMIRISPVLCIIFVFTTPIIIFITRHRARKVRPLFSRRSRLLGELNGFTEEMLSGHKTIKAYGQEEMVIGRFANRNKEAVDAYFEAEYQGSIVGPTVQFVNNFSLAMVSGLGAFLFLNRRISIGNVSSFILYSRRFSGAGQHHGRDAVGTVGGRACICADG